MASGASPPAGRNATLFCRLRPLGEVSVWGRDQPTLHWFGLTEGWYWFDVRGHELLRRIRLDHPYPYVDYYLARLWEDLVALTPDVLEPVPADLRPFIAADPAAWVVDPIEYVAEPVEGAVDPATGPPDPPVVTAAIWHGQHRLDFGYLRNAPRVRFWRTVSDERDEITVDWRHDDDGDIGFTAGAAARFTVPTTAYLAAVHTLDRDLMAVMGQRIGELAATGGIPGVDLDLAQVRQEHDHRQRWLARSLDRSPNTDWPAVRHGAHLLLGQAPQIRPPEGPGDPTHAPDRQQRPAPPRPAHDRGDLRNGK